MGKIIILLLLRVDRNFQWVGRSTEGVGCGLPGLSLKPPLIKLGKQLSMKVQPALVFTRR